MDWTKYRINAGQRLSAVKGGEIMQTLSDGIFERLMAGHSIAAEVVTTAANCRIVPDIPISDYRAAVTVRPLMYSERHPSSALSSRLSVPRGFQVLYREVPEEYLEYGHDYDVHASFEEETAVRTREELEAVLSRYVSDFARLYVGYGLE